MQQSYFSLTTKTYNKIIKLLRDCSVKQITYQCYFIISHLLLTYSHIPFSLLCDLQCLLLRHFKCYLLIIYKLLINVYLIFTYYFILTIRVYN